MFPPTPFSWRHRSDAVDVSPSLYGMFVLPGALLSIGISRPTIVPERLPLPSWVIVIVVVLWLGLGVFLVVAGFTAAEIESLLTALALALGFLVRALRDGDVR